MPFKSLILFLVCYFSIIACAETDTSSVDKFHVAGIDSPDDVKNILDNMKSSIKNNNYDYLVSITSLPIKAFVNNERIEISDRTTLKMYQSQIFNTKVIDAIEQQKFDELFVNWRGVMIGTGELWLGRKYKSQEINIIAVNNK